MNSVFCTKISGVFIKYKNIVNTNILKNVFFFPLCAQCKSVSGVSSVCSCRKKKRTLEMFEKVGMMQSVVEKFNSWHKINNKTTP